VAEEERRRKLPKNAVKPLIEYYEKKAEETGSSASEIFRQYLELMKKYEDYFFSKPWPEMLDYASKSINQEDLDFIEAGGSYAEKCERVTVVRLRHGISLEGFDSECLEGPAGLGSVPCWDCVVPDAMTLRKEIEEYEQRKRENEEEMKLAEPSWMTKRMHEYYKRPDVVRSDKMLLVKLKFYEDVGSAEGKSCEVKDKYRCPYKEESEHLIEDGRLARAIWKHIEWYDYHWNPRTTSGPVSKEMKWYHFGEPGIIDVTSYDDVIKAIDDGRLERIIEEHKRYMKETGYKAGAL